MFTTAPRGLAACLLCIVLAAPSPALAEEALALAPTEMATVIVTGTPEDPLSGKSTLSGELLEQLPLKNGSITEALTILPHVQAGEGQRTSERAGEILPPLISISGARPYENYLAVDGVGLNSLLDPLSDNVFKMDTVPGHPQRTFVNRSLLDSITVYDSNVPARYGDFVGGVVDARTRSPQGQAGGSLYYRTTGDAWAEQHIDDSREDDFAVSSYFDQQPRYRKHDGGLEFDLPMNDTMGLLAAYATLRSTLDLNHFGVEKTARKQLDNYFLKYLWTPGPSQAFELTGTYTPSDEDFFYENTKDSDLTIERGGYTLNGSYTDRVEDGEFTLTAAWLESENTRTAPAEYFSWLRTPSKDWGSLVGTTRSLEGGFGDLETMEQSLQLKLDYTLDPVALGDLTHRVSFGIAYSRDEGSYDRTEVATTYNSTVASTAAAPVVCLPGDPTCVTGEQYFNKRNIYAAGGASAVMHRQAYYVEDEITVRRVTLRLGARASHDDFLGNTNFAQRLAGSWDLFGDGGTRLLAGQNRYYGEALLTYKLREAIAPYVREKRASPLDAWVPDTTQVTTLTRFSSLDTPYSDEYTAGLKQRLFGGELFVNYLDRRHRDQFARESVTDGSQKYYVFNNNGSTDYQSWSTGWERQWRQHYLNVNYTYTESESSNELYDTTLDDALLDEEVWYDGDYVTRDELPRRDYYRPHVVNLVYVGRLPYGFTFTNVTSYRSGYQGIEALNKEEKIARGIDPAMTAYAEEDQPESWIFDWRLDWEKEIRREQVLTISLEINNVFDQKVEAGGSDDIYELGREFWLGIRYTF